MAIKSYRPYTPTRRYLTTVVSEVTKRRPEKRLTSPKAKTSGRNNQGKITIRQRGGEHKRQLRAVDFLQHKYDIEARIAAIEYDPNRSALIGLLYFVDGEKRYFLLPERAKVNDMVIWSRRRIDLKPGNRTLLKNIPAGTFVHNVELEPGCGGKMVKSAGSQAVIMSKEGDFVNLKLPSGEIRKVYKDCAASIGQVSNIDHINEVIGKAGRTRWMGRRPQVLGKSQNPVDHPHGGGEGHQPIGLPHPKTPWGKPALGLRTRNRKKKSNIYIVKRRRP